MTQLASSFPDPMAVVSAYRNLNLVGGARVPVSAGLDVMNPATGALLGQAAASGPAEVDAAVAAASAAGADWAALPARERGKRISAGARALADNFELVAQVLARETGKAIRTECRGEVKTSADILDFFGGLGSELKGETIPFNPRMLTMTTREPLGVVAAIVPWNVPLVLMMLKIAPALVAGNTVVVKASEDAPFATFLAAEILMEHLPAGVLNVINGDGPNCGAALTAHPDVAKITFTGSEEVGQRVYEAGAERIVPVSLELGGKSPMIVCADADLEKTVAGAISGMRFTRQGQSCTASSRIYVHDSLYEAFVTKLTEALDALKIGDPLDEDTDIGTIINAKQAKVVADYVAAAEAAPDAQVIRCGSMPSDSNLSPELFARPTLLLGLAEEHPCVRDEIFGPVAVVQKWSDYDDVIAKANDSRYGLAATIWTRDLPTALDATARLNAGYVQVNQNLTIQPNVSYGGFGRSGLGKEASLESMLAHFTRSKTIVMSFD